MNEKKSDNEVSKSPFRVAGGLKIIIAGGGTGGHIFPAIAIANALKKTKPDVEILFVGAKGKMEMEKVPQAGYKIEGINIAGFNRSSLIKNIGLPFKLLKSFFQVHSILKKFKPDAVIGVGGYSSFPVLRVAQAKRIPTFIHESNSFAGKSNILLGKKTTRIFVAADDMEKFFPKDKIVITGNPVRTAISGSVITRSEGVKFFSLDENKKIVLVFGGSLGARSINEVVDKNLDVLIDAGIQLIWQTGKPYAGKAKERVDGKNSVWVSDFITQMEYAYAAADIVVSRSGAMTVAELCVAKKPVLFVPYPFAAEDHQTVNAMQLVNKKAALIVKDNAVNEKLIPMIIDLAKDENKQNELKKNISALAITDADKKIAEEILKILAS
ncbi:MAG: undecaprenyldiphospho-muramoylpentapeptide beta-N-acetylglucosaminyltransferase [Bacteroidetes bacterium]|nr:undecaprenyldiphospho-muramoylpentapeptide beta-N-acetylglucosaminyltransferase [Bacteroidota bacterium]MBS1929624.1 undecaprenyldiphospho-muramoylpentapeptide beta-N-acetylglucosaminyltransferase [Bacteroidota bacterium]